MKIIKSLFEINNYNKNGIISIGFFDSIHLGHKKLLTSLFNIAKKKKLNSFVLTYENLPMKNQHKRILDLNEKLDIIKKIGIKNVILCHFDNNFKHLNPGDFIGLLKKNFKISDFVISEDFKFGKNKSGTMKILKENSCCVHYIEPFTFDNKKISTTKIKHAIKEGKIELVNCQLGRCFSITGIVKKGKQLGRKLGFPTMNVKNINILYPDDGVYITKTIIHDKEYHSMTHVNREIIETHLIGYNNFNYNFKIKVDFFKKIRDNQAFKDSEKLILQLKEDLELTELFFNSNSTVKK